MSHNLVAVLKCHTGLELEFLVGTIFQPLFFFRRCLHQIVLPKLMLDGGCTIVLVHKPIFAV